MVAQTCRAIGLILSLLLSSQIAMGASAPRPVPHTPIRTNEHQSRVPTSKLFEHNQTVIKDFPLLALPDTDIGNPIREGSPWNEQAGRTIRENAFDSASLHAFKAYFEKVYGFNRFKDVDWEFVGAGLWPRQKDLFELGKTLDLPVPGGHPKLAFFLDSIRFRGAISTMREAWRGEEDFTYPTADLIDAYMSGFAGQTLITVGHIDGNAYVVQAPDDSVLARLPIESLQEAARRHKILLFPLGCKSTEAGAPVGFTFDIKTDQVAAFLGAIPAVPRVVDILQSLGRIGKISINLARIHEMLEVLVVEPITQEVKVRLEIRVSSDYPGFSQQQWASGYKDYAAWTGAQQLPSHERGLIEWLKTAIVNHSILTWFASLVALSSMALTFDRLSRMEWLRATQQRMAFLKYFNRSRSVSNLLFFVTLALGIPIIIEAAPWLAALLIGLAVLAAVNVEIPSQSEIGKPNLGPNQST